MMFRLRRFRAFVALAFFAALAFFYLGHPAASDDRSPVPYSSNSSPSRPERLSSDSQEPFSDSKKTAENLDSLISDETGSSKKDADYPQISLPGIAKGATLTVADPFAVPTVASSTSSARPHWTKRPERFPVPKDSQISLPSGVPRRHAPLQADFTKETPAQEKERLRRLATVKKAFLKHWDGYREFAWGHDELKPLSGGYADPFAGWGATLVDSLDTLWIMGLEEEFEEAVNATAHIDFTTTSRQDIPLFEVTIRYLGGLLGAFDISGHRYPVLLDKAVELAEVLYGAFDTPNRMPITYFNWRPTAGLPERSTRNVVLAELGSLSIEFTRLAQLTNETKYYDAVARITNGLDEYQRSSPLPGMWPTYLDATGCNKIVSTGDSSSVVEHSRSNGPNTAVVGPPLHAMESSLAPEAAKQTAAATANDGKTAGAASSGATDARLQQEEQLRQGVRDKTQTKPRPKSAEKFWTLEDQIHKRDEPLFRHEQFGEPSDADYCEPTGLKAAYSGKVAYTWGGMADSVYEYLPKQWQLLGGLEPQYQEMHEAAMEAMKEYSLYKPMIPDKDRDILFTGTITTDGKRDKETGRIEGILNPSTGHLTCFIGAVVGLGAKLYKRKGELEIAAQLTDGCVWAYEQTATGVMAEDITPVVCGSWDEPCHWNKTEWWHTIDPWSEKRAAEDLEKWEKAMEKYEAEHGSATSRSQTEHSRLDKRQLYLDDDDADALAIRLSSGMQPAARPVNGAAKPDSVSSPGRVGDSQQANSAPSKANVAAPDTQQDSDPVVPPPPKKPQTYEERVESQIKANRLTPGIARINGRNYILRPEAIESVFYMYRLTGDRVWQEKGWRMWQAVWTATDSKYGASAIYDTTLSPPWIVEEQAQSPVAQRANTADAAVEAMHQSSSSSSIKHSDRSAAPSLNNSTNIEKRDAVSNPSSTRNSLSKGWFTDKAESFWTGETLKYFYLLFADEDLVSLDDWVFNTEAHPMRVPREAFA